ncbi:hypothetical protein, unlikely [Trypanosoma brucei gambiense DAL972]|uniref:Uncharacterized protein n=1 Tax=Trypanosoma brucei gambiense (strain MHOM/CI/86/DAL972) TaxID=679716 RepID=C9ZUA4_TRYB9|nr:hypothetical protein, unlikely [Trypanosoma brucei gambiense DAL972]CBH12991.1 hypothetical protein, unlikely [Trypanosoma brucei gambiense DAL972]|eukprot:XP_011775269.1 hypothetical protein, unlikely [Trypanosoma brucei gambiense DAL972]
MINISFFFFLLSFITFFRLLVRVREVKKEGIAMNIMITIIMKGGRARTVKNVLVNPFLMIISFLPAISFLPFVPFAGILILPFMLINIYLNIFEWHQCHSFFFVYTQLHLF